MTFGDLKLMLAQQVNRSDMESTWYPIWINRALRRIQNDTSFTFMRSRADVTMAAGESSATLPDDFKELTPEKSAITIVDPSLISQGVLAELPCELTSRENMLNYRAATFVPSRPANVRGRLAGLPVYLDRRWSGVSGSTVSTGGTTINILDVTAEPLAFRVSYFAYLPALANDVDTNTLLLEYPDLVESKVKSIAFSALNDPVATNFELASGKLLAEAVLDDKRRLNSGRVYRMGG